MTVTFTGVNAEKLIAIFSYESRSEGDLGFEKDDVLIVLDNS